MLSAGTSFIASLPIRAPSVPTEKECVNASGSDVVVNLSTICVTCSSWKEYGKFYEQYPALNRADEDLDR